MNNKIPLQDGRSFRGSSSNNTTVSQLGYNGYIPAQAFTDLSWEAAGVIYGTATLKLHIRDGKLVRYATSRERSFVSVKPTTGSQYE